jgi:hypothetical protein
MGGCVNDSMNGTVPFPPYSNDGFGTVPDSMASPLD